MNRLPLLLVALAIFSAGCGREQNAPSQPAGSSPATSATGDAGRGQELIKRHGCNVCHAVPGIDGFQGRLGPSLAGIAGRPMISNGKVQNTPANLATFVREPASLNPESTMPPIALTPQEADDIAAYLLTLR